MMTASFIKVQAVLYLWICSELEIGASNNDDLLWTDVITNDQPTTWLQSSSKLVMHGVEKVILLSTLSLSY